MSQGLLSAMSLKSVLITDCSRGGIGSALAEFFQKRNLQVSATARCLSKMSHLSKLPNVNLLTLDVTSTADICKAFDCVKSKIGSSLDYLVNNSGISYICLHWTPTFSDAKAMFDVNFWAVLAVIQCFSPLLIAVKGSIVNNGSINSVLNPPWMGIYGASKAALRILDETLRLELGPFQVKVLTVITGAIDTNLMNNGPAVKIPPNSLYRNTERTILARAQGEDVFGKVKTNQYAERIVSDILDGATGKVWRGGMAAMVRHATSVLPTFMIVRWHYPRMTKSCTLLMFLGSYVIEENRIRSTLI